MADTRKDKLQAMLEAMEASKSKMTRQQLLDIANQKAKPEGYEEGVLEAEVNSRLGRPVAEAKSIMPPQVEVMEVEAVPVDEMGKAVNLPYMGEKRESVTLPDKGGVQRVRKLFRLYRMMQ
jgi:hypothetical protein